MATKRIRSAQLFAALGDETRLGLITRLCASGPMSVSALTVDSRVTRQGVTKHLRVMERVGLARGKRHGRESVWEVDLMRIEDAQRYLEEISTQWDEALARLQKFVER